MQRLFKDNDSVSWLINEATLCHNDVVYVVPDTSYYYDIHRIFDAYRGTKRYENMRICENDDYISFEFDDIVDSTHKYERFVCIYTVSGFIKSEGSLNKPVVFHNVSKCANVLAKLRGYKFVSKVVDVIPSEPLE